METYSTRSNGAKGGINSVVFTWLFRLPVQVDMLMHQHLAPYQQQVTNNEFARTNEKKVS